MFASKVLRLPRKPFSELDFARHMPEEYVKRMKRTVPRKVWGGRFGAPDIVRYHIHPDDYVPNFGRPWEHDPLGKAVRREENYHQAKLSNKFFNFRRPKVTRLPDEQWTFFPGDLVQVMVGKDKGRQGTVLQVSRDTNEIIVDGLHTKLEEDMPGSEKLGIQRTFRNKEQPLDVSKGQVQLVDPNSSEPCDAEWRLNDAGTEYIRISKLSGFEIPIPSQAKVTYEYTQIEKYLEVEDKDTPADLVLQRTYTPKLCSFEDDILSSVGIKDSNSPKPTYWY